MDDPNTLKLTQAPDQKHHHRVLLYGFTVLLIISIAIGAGYLLGMKNTQTTPQPVVNPPVVAKPTPTVDSTANWKTYTNSQLGYSIKYPSTIANFQQPPKTPGTVLPPDLVQNVNIAISVPQGGIIFFITMWRNLGVTITDTASRDQWCSLLQKELTGQLSCDYQATFSTVQIHENTAYQITGGRDNFLEKILYIPYGQYVYQLEVPVQDTNGNKFPVTDQMLSTFTFTNQNQTTSISSVEACTNENTAIISLVNTFESLQKQRNNPTAVLQLFTPPVSQQDKSTYGFLSGQDNGITPRLYNSGETNFQEQSFAINGTATAITDGKCSLSVTEQRSMYKEGVGGYYPAVNVTITFVVTKVNNQWMIDQYFSKTGGLPGKYSGW